jgi:two-component system, OmpR family, alkaline phosphatase synthesis response regulator PhoP
VTVPNPLEPQRPLRILVVDDDENLRRLVAAYLEREGYEMSEAGDGEAALRELQKLGPDLVILDVMLPGLDGFEVARRIKASRDLPILMLTARGDEADVLAGFDAGVDDYLAKPFSPKVLVARVRAILRRSGLEQEAGDTVVVGDMVIDLRAREVRVAGRPLDLTSTEFDLLRTLAGHPGWVYSREELLETVWGYSFVGESRVVDVHVANLRKKIGEDPADPRYLRTVRGAGYKLQAPIPEEGGGS